MEEEGSRIKKVKGNEKVFIDDSVQATIDKY